jgi:hypothetical protein
VIAARTGDRVVAVVERRHVGPAASLVIGDSYRSAFGGADVVVLSIEPELESSSLPADALTSYREAMGTLVPLLEEDGAHVVVMNGSTVVPGDEVHCYRVTTGAPASASPVGSGTLARVHDPPSLTVQRLNAAVLRVAVEHGVSILDVDRVIAELGGAKHVTGLQSYSDAAGDAVCEELALILSDRGLLDDRSVAAPSVEGSRAWPLRLEMPKFAKRVEKGTVRKWHVGEGAAIAYGDDLLDIQVTKVTELVRLREHQHLRDSAERDDRFKTRRPRQVMNLRVTAAESGVLARIYAPEGTAVAVGDLLAVVTDLDIDVDADPPPDGSPTLRVVAENVPLERPAVRGDASDGRRYLSEEERREQRRQRRLAQRRRSLKWRLRYAISMVLRWTHLRGVAHKVRDRIRR